MPTFCVLLADDRGDGETLTVEQLQSMLAKKCIPGGGPKQEHIEKLLSSVMDMGRLQDGIKKLREEMQMSLLIHDCLSTLLFHSQQLEALIRCDRPKVC